MGIIISVICICIAIYCGIQYQKLQKASGRLHQLEQQHFECEKKYNVICQQRKIASETLEELTKEIAQRQEESSSLREVVIDLRVQKCGLNDAIEDAQRQLTYLQSFQDESCKKIKEETQKRISSIEEECAKVIDEKRVAAQQQIEDYSLRIENERQKYLSIIETITKISAESEREQNRHIQIKGDAQEDIAYLLNNVAKHLSNPDILYKLIWSEYVQKPTNVMLDHILPEKDCAGIYKITDDSNKKSYIGRSTSVRKRLADHIKSAVGISTIAHQHIHEVMREKGLWNFSFELIEECDKNQLNEREKYYIDFFQTAEAMYGYNQKAGG